ASLTGRPEFPEVAAELPVADANVDELVAVGVEHFDADPIEIGEGRHHLFEGLGVDEVDERDLLLEDARVDAFEGRFDGRGHASPPTFFFFKARSIAFASMSSTVSFSPGAGELRTVASASMDAPDDGFIFLKMARKNSPSL